MDVIVGVTRFTNGESNEGGAFVFHGGPAGLSSGRVTSADATIESNQPQADLGFAVSIAIDVQPDRSSDMIHPLNRRIPVALFGSEYFDVADLDRDSIGFGPDAAPPRSRWRVNRDIDGDGFHDAILWFRTDEAGIGPHTEEACSGDAPPRRTQATC